MNRKHTLFFALLVCFAMFFSACSADKDRYYLAGGWKYSLSENGEYKQLDDSQLGNLEKLVPAGIKYIYLKNEFTLPRSLQDKELGVYLGRITMADQTYLNGSLIGSTGKHPPHEFSAWNTARYYHIDSDLIQNGKNSLVIRIYLNGEGAIVSNPFIGLASDAKRSAEIEAFWNARIHMLCAFFMILIGAYHFLLFIKRKKDKENLVFALMNVIMAIYLSVFYIDEIPFVADLNISFLWFQKIVSSGMPFLFPFMVTNFVNSFLRRKERLVPLILQIVFMIAPIAVLMFAPNYPTLRAMRTLTQAFLVPPMLYLLYILIYAKIKKTPEINSLLLGFSPLVALFGFDLIIHNVLHFYNVPYIMSFGWLCVVLALLFILAGRFADARKQAEDLNEHLEKKVEERTKELSESNARLEEADRIAKKDMRLAVYVQQSFYPKSAPKVDGWDIAYIFKPMAGVSGDLYDFYTEGSKLKGISLFDVSGHGIASGLVTMLAKTIISQQFEAKSDEKLSVVMQSVSQNVAESKGDIENYLTGILLRIKGDYVTYVNGAHPSMLHQSASGSVHAVAMPGKQPQGPVVGIAGIDGPYENLSILMRPGDSLVLYTDCLTETTNEAGEQFTEEGVINTLKKAAGKSAQEKLGVLLDGLKEYAAGKPLNDDLTVIILQKK